MFDKWMFVLSNLSRLLERPVALQERIFTKLFEQAEIAKYSTEERREYEASVKNYWDYFSTMKTAAQNASNSRALEIAKEMKKDGMSNTLIAKYTGLSIEQIEAL
jgi:predicted transposase/invertase (TIGR01784 family)